MLQQIPIHLIDRRKDARPLNEASVASLADSIAAIGLINPIRVRAVGDRWEVSAGSHRLAACESLGLADIDCIVVTDDDLHAELSMIDENLCRNELSPSERAVQTARRKVIYEELHPETKHGGDRKSYQVDKLSTRSFSEATAAATGKDERSVRRDAERGAKVIQEVIDLITGTKLDTGTYLDVIKRLSPNDQVTKANRDLAKIASDEREKKRHEKKMALDADVRQRAAKQIAELIAEHIPADAWEHVKANLAVTTSKEVLIAFTNITGESVLGGRRAA